MATDTTILDDHRVAQLRLSLLISDPDVVHELSRHEEGTAREHFAGEALRLGVLAVRQASGTLDAETIQREGDRIVGSLREVLAERSKDIGDALTKILGTYLDPESGVLTRRLEDLAGQDGELEAVFNRHLAGEQSTLALALSTHMGKESPLFKLLSPTQKDGLVATLTDSVRRSLDEQRQEIFRQFSLNRPDSALSRVVEQLSTSNRKLKTDLSGEVATIAKEFSLDNDQGALARFRRELMGALEPMAAGNAKFQAEIRAAVEALKARREEAAKSTRHGVEFEVAVGNFLRGEAEKVGELFENVATSNGTMGRKVGDHVLTLGEDSAGAGGRVVCEAKAQQKLSDAKLLAELAIARENREAEVGVLVLDAKAAPEGTLPLRRFGSDVLVLWDADDEGTDVQLRAALSLARALVVRERAARKESEVDLRELDKAIDAIAKTTEGLDKIAAQANTIRRSEERISSTVKMLRELVDMQVAKLRATVDGLRPEAE